MTKAVKRIYVVTEHGEAGIISEKLVKAASQAQAISHVVKGRFAATIPTTDEALRLATAGVTVQDAGSE